MADPKSVQEAEGKARAEQGVNPAETTAAIDVVDDGGAQDPGAPRAAAPADTGENRPAPPVKSKFDDKRNAIVGRFRENRTTESDAERDDITDFARSGMPPEFAETNTPVINPPADPDPADDAPAPVPKKFKVKVHGQDRELTEDELVAQAQIALASDGLLDASKARLKEADGLLESIKAKVPRADQPGKHHAGQDSAQTAEHSADGDPVEHHDDKLTKLIETMQFGDPAEASTLLQNTIAEEAGKQARTAVDETLRSQRLADEAGRTNKVLTDFRSKHADIAADPMAIAAIERKTLDLQLEDIKALGIDPAQLPTATPGVLTPADIALAHKWYRAEGFKVRKADEMLETAMSDYLAWKGTGAKPSPAEPAQAQPHVEVTIDRSARRQAVPQQPSRTASPRQAQAPQPPAQPRDRSSIVQAEIARRNAPRGRIVA